uniref:Uncharacterized protein n=1 Tax=Arundo donax TaxID=35708 RepID=A0A0A9CGA7_ARUDO
MEPKHAIISKSHPLPLQFTENY